MVRRPLLATVQQEHAPTQRRYAAAAAADGMRQGTAAVSSILTSWLWHLHCLEISWASGCNGTRHPNS